MFYLKKKNDPNVDDLIVYKSMKQLMKYEGIGRNTYQFERKIGLIVTTYLLIEKKGEFDYYRKGYIRFGNATLLDKMSSAIKRKKSFTKLN